MLLTTLLLTPAALTQPPPGPGPRLVPPFLHQAEELGLLGDQKSRLKAILDGHRGSMEAKTLADRQAHKSLMDAVREGVGDLGALNQAAAAAQLALLQEAQQLNAACLAVLTAGQREKAKALRPQRPEAGGRPQKPEGRGPGHATEFP